MQWNVTKSCWSSSLKFYYFWHNLGFVNKSSYQNIFSIWLKCMREPLHLNFITQKCLTTYTEGYRKKGTGCCLVFYKHSCPPPSPPKEKPSEMTFWWKNRALLHFSNVKENKSTWISVLTAFLTFRKNNKAKTRKYN